MSEIWIDALQNFLTSDDWKVRECSV